MVQTQGEGRSSPVKNRLQHKMLILGGGTAGLTVAAQLRRKGEPDIAIIEPSSQPFYQAAWTLVGAGVYRPAATARDEAPLIPRGVRWIQDCIPPRGT